MSEQEGIFRLLCTIPEAALPRWLPKEVEVEHALSTTVSRSARYPHLTHLTLSTSDELLLSSSTANTKEIVLDFNIALTVKDTNTGKREMTTLKYSADVAYSVNLKLIMY